MSVFEIITEDEFRSSGHVDRTVRTDEIPPLKCATEEWPEAGVGLEIDSLPTVTYPCDFCGHCETPNDCAWSHTCPKCGAPAGVISVHSMCKTPTGGIVGIHAERWKGVKS